MQEYQNGFVAQSGGFIGSEPAKNADASKYTVTFRDLTRDQMAQILSALSDQGYPVTVIRQYIESPMITATSPPFSPTLIN